MNRPDRPWPYWYEVRIEYMGLFRHRPKYWWRDMFLLPYTTWLSQRAEKALYELITPNQLRDALFQATLKATFPGYERED